MQLLQITLEHVRLHRQLNLPLASGITVLEGANESGKSTLAEAIHRALFLPARTAGAALNQLRTRPFEADPTISLQFSADGNTYQLRKTFAGSRGSVSLSDAAGSVLEGERAEERLAQLVGASAVRGGNLGRLRERWAHLWVWQGQAGVDPLSLAPATIDQERLLQQLQHQAQTIQSGFDQQIQQAIRQRWSLSHTDGGREGRAGSELDRALKAEAKAAENLSQLEQDEQAQQQAQRDFAEAASALQALDAQLPLLKQRQQLQDQQQRVQEQLSQWQPVLQRGEQAAEHLQQLRHSLAPAQAQLEALQQRLPETELSFKAASEALDQAIAQAETLQQWMRVLQLQQQADQLQALAIRSAELKQRAEQLPALEPADLESLQQLERSRQDAAVALASLSTGLELTATDQALLLNDQPLRAGDALDLDQDAELRSASGGFVLQIRPGGAGRLNQLRQTKAQLDQQLSAALQRWNLPDVKAAKASERERRELIAEWRQLRSQQGAIAVDQLRQQIAALPEPPKDADLSQLREQLDALVPQGKALRLQRNQAEADLSQQRQQLEQLQASCQSDLQHQTRAQTVLEEVQQSHGGLESFRQQVSRLQQELKQGQQQLQRLDEQLQRQGVHRLDGVSPVAVQHQRDQWLQQRAASRALLESQGERGLQEQLEMARADLEDCASQRQTLQDEARMLNLLLQTFEQEQAQLSESYSAPLADSLEAYLRCFTKAPSRLGLRFDPRQGFVDLDWQRDSGVAWGFDDLSGGTRELLAAAVRMAMAEVLAPAYDGVLPVLFDDAFTNVDPSRWSALNAMFQRARERGVQVLLLSCDPNFSAAIQPDVLHQLPLRTATPTALHRRRSAA